MTNSPESALGSVSKLRNQHLLKIEAECSTLQTPLSARNGDNGQWVTLNVGGTVFETTVRTLSSCPASLLCTMLQQRQQDETMLAAVGITARNNNNNTITGTSSHRSVYHIDRDPQLFSMILQFLRTRDIMHLSAAHDLSCVNLDALLAEAKHFQIDSLVRQLNATIHGHRNLQECASTFTKDSAAAAAADDDDDGNLVATPPDFSRRQLINALISMPVDQQPRFRGVNFNLLDLSRLSMRNANAELSSFVRSICMDTDFTMSNLRRTHWAHSDIRGAILNEVDLEGSVLHRVDMTNCNLKNANLSKVRFSGGCQLVNTTFHGCSFEHSTICGANIQGTSFRDCNLAGVNFVDRNTIVESQFHDCQFLKTSFSKSVERQQDSNSDHHVTTISRSVLHCCTFQHMELDMVHMSYVDFSESSFDHVKLDLKSMKDNHCVIANTAFMKCDWSNVDLSSFNVGNVKLTECDVRDTNFRGSNLHGTLFRTCDMRRAVLRDCLIDTQTSFIECDLRMAVYEPSHFATHSVNLERSNFAGEDWSCQRTGDDGTRLVHNMRLSGANMSSMNLCGVDLSYGVLENADMSQSTLTDAVLEYCKLKDTRIEFDELRKTKSIIGSDFTGANWSNKNLSGMCLREVILRDANLQNSDFDKVDFTDAVLDGADLRYANFNADDLELASTEGARLYGENIISSSFGDVSGDLFVHSIDDDNAQANIISDSSYRFHKIQCMEFHGNMGLMGTEDGTILVATLNPENIVDKIDGHGSVDCLQFSRDIMCCNRREKIEIWNWREKSRLGVLYGHSKMVQSLVFFDRTLISASYDSTISVWDLETQQRTDTLKYHQGSVKVLNLDEKDRRTLISGGKDSEMFVWDLRTSTLRPTHRLQLDKGINSVNLMTRVGDQLIWCGVGDTSLRVWDLRFIPALSTVTDLSPSSSFVDSQPTLHSSSLLSSPGSPSITPDSSFHSGYSLTHSLPVNSGKLAPITPLQDTSTDLPIPYASVRYKASVLLGLQKQESGNKLRRLSINGIPSMSRSHEEQGLYHDVYVGDSRILEGHTLPISSLASLGNTIATGGEDCVVNVWDLSTGQLRRSVHSHNGPVRCISIV